MKDNTQSKVQNTLRTIYVA